MQETDKQTQETAAELLASQPASEPNLIGNIEPATPVPEAGPTVDPSATITPAFTASVPVTGTEQAEWVCPECGKRDFEYRSLLVRHIQHAHKDKAETIIANIPASTGKRSRRTLPDFADLQQQPQADIQAAQALAAQAGLAFDMSTNLLSGIFGPEWKPQSEQERQMVVQPLAAYLKTLNVPELPPKYILCFCCLAYAAPRLQATTTKTKLKVGWLWLKDKFSSVFNRKPRLQVVKE